MSRMHPNRLVALCLLLPFPSLLIGLGQDPKTAPLERQGKLVRDAAICSDCHEDEAAAIGDGVHARVPKSKLLDACETCHGPGALHVEEQEAAQITLPTLLAIGAQRRLCRKCHADQIAEHGGPLDELLAAGKKCTSCHKVHQPRADVPGAGDARAFTSRDDLTARAGAEGMRRCLTCHARHADSLATRTHADLLHARSLRAAGFAKWNAQRTCEACHGNGSLHVATNGIARLITRPDRAADGIATCRQCHAGVDAERFHWSDGHDPLIGAPAGGTLTCTTCHKVHGDGDPTLAAPRPEPVERPASRPSRSGASVVATHADAHTEPGDCRACHAPAYRALHGTIHADLARADLPAGRGCVSCHPGGGAHARSGGRKELVVSLRGTNAAFQAKVCLECHGGDQDVCGYSLGVHAKADISCLHCHSPAAPAAPHAMAQDAHKSCGSCHGDVGLSFRHANGHPIGQGEFTCSSCHDPHQPRRLGIDAGRVLSARCVECHREYRGPYVFPHHADKGRGCLACHLPHGSSNRKLLDKRRARDNCLSCHADLPAFHDLSPGSQYRNCLNCHTHVHGSNRSRFFFR